MGISIHRAGAATFGQGMPTRFETMQGSLRQNWVQGEAHDPHEPQFTFTRQDGKSFPFFPTPAVGDVFSELGALKFATNPQPFTVEAYVQKGPIVGGATERLVARHWYQGHSAPEL